MTRRRIAEIPLGGHPESFQLDLAERRLFVNVPAAREIAVIDLVEQRLAASWPVREAAANFPLALDGDSRMLLIVARQPPRLIAFDEAGGLAAVTPSCGDADDLFVDRKRRRIYVSCGEGVIDVLQQITMGYASIAHVPTAADARTALFVPEEDRLFVAVRATAQEPASVWVFRPSP
jgi:hypothetical protein